VAPEIFAADGRRLGRRAQQTRLRLLDATAQLLRDQGARDLRVVDVARSVGTSPATFYQYFRDVDEALLALAEEAGAAVRPLAELVHQSWRGRVGLDAARILVDSYIAYWDRHRPVLTLRNVAAQDGDERFRAVRNGALSLITDPLSERIAEAQDEGQVGQEITPYAAAAAMVAMLERMAAYHTNLEPRGVNRDDMVETLARILFQTVTGRRVGRPGSGTG